MIIVDNEQTFESMEDLRNYMEENFEDSAFDEVLNETEEPVNILGVEYSPARVLKEVDPTAYRTEKLDYFDWIWRDIEQCLEERSECNFNGFLITMEEEEKEEEEE